MRAADVGVAVVDGDDLAPQRPLDLLAGALGLWQFRHTPEATIPGRMPRSRRTCHAVPGSNERFIAKAVDLDADEVFLDLEDAVAPNEKDSARERVIEALRTHDFGAKTVVVRVNGTDTPHYYKDLIAVVEQAGEQLDAIMLPKVRTPGDVEMTDKLLTQIELASGYELGPDRDRGADRGRDRPDRLRGDRRRLAAHGDADLRPRRLQRRGRHPDHDDRRRARRLPGRPPQLRLLAARRGRPRGRHPGDRRPVRARGRRRRAARALALARALGLDGKWTIHPGQIAIVNEVFSPAREQWERAEAMLSAYDEAHRDGHGRRGVRGRDDRRGQPQDGRADRRRRAARRGTRHEPRRAHRPARASAVVILVVAFIALRPSAEDEGSTAETPTETPSAAAPTETPDGGRDRDADALADAAPTVDPGPS